MSRKCSTTLIRRAPLYENIHRDSQPSPAQMFMCIPQTPEELEDDSDFEQEDYDTRSRTSVQTEDDQLIAGQSARVS